MDSAYETTINLPSEGIPYSDGVSSVTIRPMTTAEEKYIYGSSANRANTLLKLLDSCVVPDANGNKVDTGEFMAGDFDYVLTQLRIISFGHVYHQVGACPYCENVENHEVDLRELQSKEMDIESYTKYQTLELSNGDKVELRILSQKQLLDINDRVDKIIRNSKIKPDRDFLMIQHLRAAELDKVNGENYSHEKALLYLNKLLAVDGAKLDYYNNHMLDSFGIQNSFEVTCSNCSESYDVQFVNHGEFFRPRFD